MTDKEQKNDLLKNKGKNFNENSTQENKPIIIDGVDASGCEFYKHNDKNSERFAKMFEFALEDNNLKSDKQTSTEYTGVYTGIFPE